MSVDYRPTVFLPKTDFPMRAGLAANAPKVLERWEAIDLFARQREVSAGREQFILHDGPPYATGHLHNDTDLNKILNDVINHAHHTPGKDAHYAPGGDYPDLPQDRKRHGRRK